MDVWVSFGLAGDGGAREQLVWGWWRCCRHSCSLVPIRWVSWSETMSMGCKLSAASFLLPHLASICLRLTLTKNTEERGFREMQFSLAKLTPYYQAITPRNVDDWSWRRSWRLWAFITLVGARFLMHQNEVGLPKTISTVNSSFLIRDAQILSLSCNNLY